MNQDEAALIAQEVLKAKKRDLWYKRWRNVALALLVLSFSQLSDRWNKEDPLDLAHIVMLNINETIHQDSEFWKQFGRIDQKNAKAALILMNSPGGTPGDSERLYNEIMILKSKMPVTILIENQATSGALLAAMASDRIYAYNSAMIGSIGVVFSHNILKGLMDKVGIENEMFTIGDHKGYPNSYEKTPQLVVENIEDVLKSDQKWFLETVVKSRKLDESVIPKIKEAQIYNAKDGIVLGLIDGISTRQGQVELLRDEVGDLKVKNLEIDENENMLQALLKPRKILGMIAKESMSSLRLMLF